MKYLKAKNVRLPERADSRIANHIRRGRWYEDGMLAYIHELGVGGSYLDVGANIGNHALYLAANTPRRKSTPSSPRRGCAPS
jgi:hypothetical protein